MTSTALKREEIIAQQVCTGKNMHGAENRSRKPRKQDFYAGKKKSATWYTYISICIGAKFVHELYVTFILKDASNLEGDDCQMDCLADHISYLQRNVKPSSESVSPYDDFGNEETRKKCLKLYDQYGKFDENKKPVSIFLDEEKDVFRQKNGSGSR